MVRKEGKKIFMLSERHEDILKAVYSYRFVTALDMTNLFYSPSAIAYVWRLLSELAGGADYTENAYLYRFPLQQTGAGNRVRVYTLGNRGRDFLRDQLELPVTWYFRPDKVRHLNFGQLTHNLILTRFLVAAKRWAASRQDAELLQTRTCYELGAGEPAGDVVKEGKRESGRVIPDAWLLFVKRRGERSIRFPLLLEIDRGTAYRQKFKEHIAARIEFVKKGGAYRDVFGEETVMIAYATTGETGAYREARRASMCAWTRELLAESHKERWAGLFRFHSLTLAEMYEVGMFEEPVWYRPDSDEPVGLFTT